MEYVLFVIMISTKSQVIAPQEFRTKENCEYARQVIQLELELEEYQGFLYGKRIKTLCVKK